MSEGGGRDLPAGPAEAPFGDGGRRRDATTPLTPAPPRPAPRVRSPNVCREWNDNMASVLFSEEQIAKRVNELAKQITKDYEGKKVLFVGLLTGAFVFCADLLRKVALPYDLDMMVVSSYGKGTQSSGNLKIKKDLSIDPHGRHVVIVEDLIDSGVTLDRIIKHIRSKDAASVRVCCLLNKTERRVTDAVVDYIGFDCPDEFVVGYGMDFADDYRCLPFVGILKPRCFAHLFEKGPEPAE